jgi:hypothetical protein
VKFYRSSPNTLPDTCLLPFPQFTFREPKDEGSSSETSVNCRTSWYCLPKVLYLLMISLNIFPDRGDMFLRNVDWLSTDYTALFSRRYNSSLSPVWQPQILFKFNVSFIVSDHFSFNRHRNANLSWLEPRYYEKKLLHHVKINI